MKIFIIFFLLGFHFVSFCQTNYDSILQELDLNQESEKRIIEYRKSLKQNKLKYLYNISFKISYNRKDSLLQTNGTATYKSNFFIEKIDFDKSLPEKDKEKINKFFNQIYRLANTYYKYSTDKNSISENFYSLKNDNSNWYFTLKRNIKKQHNIDTTNKMSFNVHLDYIGNIKSISTLLDSNNGLIKNNKDDTSHNINIHFISDENTTIIKAINGEVRNIHKDNIIEFEIEFY